MGTKYVLFHSKCYDGFGAAYAAWKALGDTAKYIPVSYGYPPPEMPDATHIYIVDFSYPPEILLDLVNRGAPVTVIDHHKTAQEALNSLVGAHSHLHTIFNMEKSGALLTWEYFHRYPADAPSDPGLPIPAPLLIQHISDRDLWKFEMDGTAKIHKALVSLPMDFKLWDTLDVEQLKKDGEICERLYTQLVENICDGSYQAQLDGHKIPVVNTSIAWSEVGHELAKRYPDAPFVASFTVFDSQVMWSLRSIGEFDVSAVAKKFGGGGHKNAAGFKTVKA
jgi:oligoribonuclease NrnB/cAMP/cGMP phosphodiesterase (DHH superfamily)